MSVEVGQVENAAKTSHVVSMQEGVPAKALNERVDTPFIEQGGAIPLGDAKIIRFWYGKRILEDGKVFSAATVKWASGEQRNASTSWLKANGFIGDIGGVNEAGEPMLEQSAQQLGIVIDENGKYSGITA